MTNSNSTCPKESIAQDSIPMQQMNRDCEIGTLGKYVVMMSLSDLKEIANGELRAYSEELEHENSALQAKLGKAVEALNKILKRAKEIKKDGFSEYARRVCQNVLKEIER